MAQARPTSGFGWSWDYDSHNASGALPGVAPPPPGPCCSGAGGLPAAAAGAAMGALVFFGCTFIAFGPALALCLLTVAGDPLRVIILVAGAFFWLVSLLLASLIWFISVQLSNREDGELQHALLMFGAAVSVLLQEAFRFAYFKLLKKADEGLMTISEDGQSPISVKQMAYVSGLSFGIISGVFSVINILADSIGPGTVGIHGDSPHYFIASAFLTMAIVLLHTFWGTIFFDACEKKCYWKLSLVVASHLMTSGLTFLNPCYEASLIPIFMITLSTGVWAFFTAGGSLHSILACLSCRRKEENHVMLYSELQLPAEN